MHLASVMKYGQSNSRRTVCLPYVGQVGNFLLPTSVLWSLEGPSRICCQLILHCSLLSWFSLPMVQFVILCLSPTGFLLGPLSLWLAGAPEATYSCSFLGGQGFSCGHFVDLTFSIMGGLTFTTILILTISPVLSPPMTC